MHSRNTPTPQAFVAVVDDDTEILEAISVLLDMEGYRCQTFTSASALIDSGVLHRIGKDAPMCILSDVMMPGIDGLELQQHLNETGDFQMILMSGSAGTRDVAQAFRAGVVDFLTKPFEDSELLSVLEKAQQHWRQRHEQVQRDSLLQGRLKTLTKRELEVAKLVSQGETNQAIADKLHIVLRTVKLHRQRAMEKLDCRRVVDLARLLDETNKHAEVLSLRQEAKKWENAALSDPMTGVLNRRGLEHFGTPLLSKSSPLSVAVLDADFFKKINDSFGHHVGDRVLVTLCKQMSAHSREDDLVVRLGGEEFALVMPDTALSSALQTCERIRLAVQNHHWNTLDADLRISISIGLVQRSTENALSALLDRADQALYRAKKEGRNRVCVAP